MPTLTPKELTLLTRVLSLHKAHVGSVSHRRAISSLMQVPPKVLHLYEAGINTLAECYSEHLPPNIRPDSHTTESVAA